MDFETDLKNELHSGLDVYGIKIPIRKDLDDMLLDYLTIHKKLIRPTPRVLYQSPVLEEKMSGHPKVKEINAIKSRLQSGRDVNFFQSKRLFQARFHDHLLYEWNVYHFHLSLEKEKKSNFFKQTDALLFAYIDDFQAILLDVSRHADGVFGDLKWLEIVDRYFPDVLKPFYTEQITDISPNVNPIERQSLWNKGITLGLNKVNGKIFHSPGIGRTTSGHSLQVVRTANEIHRWLHSAKEHFESYGKEIANVYGIDPEMASFRLRFGEVTLEIYDESTYQQILEFPNVFQFETEA